MKQNNIPIEKPKEFDFSQPANLGMNLFNREYYRVSPSPIKSISEN